MNFDRFDGKVRIRRETFTPICAPSASLRFAEPFGFN